MPSFCELKDNEICSKQEIKFCKHSPNCTFCQVTKNKIKTSDIEFLVETHHKVKESCKFNFQECRIPINTRINVNYIRNWLCDYKDKIICDLLEFGFPLGYQGDDTLLQQFDKKYGN